MLRRLTSCSLWIALGLALGCGGVPNGDPASAAGAARRARTEVAGLLAAQAAAWNRGDLAGFTAAYAEDATFVSPSGVTHGRGQVLARYRRRYPDRRAMGILNLEILEARPLGGAAGEGDKPGIAALSVVAHWRLSYAEEPGRKTAEGSTLLVLQKTAGGWEIVQDASM